MNVATICDHLPLTDRFGLGQRCRSVLETLMANNLAESIEKWFLDREGEFVDYGSKFPSYKNSSFATAEVLVYTTKYHALTRVAINSLVPMLVFWDDLGCQDSMIYKQSKQHTQGLSFSAMLTCRSADICLASSLYVHRVSWRERSILSELLHRSLDRIHIALSECELASLTFLAQIMPEYPALVGHYCSMLLANGFKIELEGATMSIET